jgi:hypothetical protein
MFEKSDYIDFIAQFLIVCFVYTVPVPPQNVT